MSSVVGTVSIQGAVNEETAWLQRAARLLYRGRAPQHTQWNHGDLRVIAAARPSEPPLSVSSRDGVALFVSGDLYGACRGGADSLLEQYLQCGLDSCKDLNGAFVIGIFDERIRTLLLLTDRLGLRRLYYTTTPHQFSFASEIKALLVCPAVSRAIDPRGLAHLLSVGYVLDDRTLYESVRLLQGGTILSYHLDGRRVTLRRYWEPRHSPNGHHRLEDYADELARRLRVALERQLHGINRIGISLSGGLDSRTILGFARMLQPEGDIQTFTAGPSSANDLRFAQQLGQICQTDHHVLPLDGTYLLRQAAHAAWLTEGMGGILGSWRLELSDLAAKTCDRLFVGFIGGGFTGYAAPLGLASSNGRSLAHRVFEAYNVIFSEVELKTLLHPQRYPNVRGVAEEDFCRSIETVQADSQEVRLMLADLLQRQQRFLSHILTTLGAALPVSAPFADNEVVEWLLGTPFHYKRGKAAYKNMLKRHLPVLARVPTSATGLPLDAGRWRQVTHAWRDKVLHEVPRWSGGTFRPLDQRIKLYHGRWMRQPHVQAYLREVIVRNAQYLEELCDAGAVHRLFERQMSNEGGSCRKTNVLLGLLLWFEQVARL